MNEDVINDLKQFIAATVSQQTSKLQDDIAGLRGDIAEIRGDISEIRIDISEIRGDIKRVDQKLTI